MYLNFATATNRIRSSEGKKTSKNPNYKYNFIHNLLQAGVLERAEPQELFVKNEKGDFVSIGNIGTESLVTEKSVNDYIERRKKEFNERGCYTKCGKPIEAIFSDGSKSVFSTTGDAQKFFGIKYHTLRRAMETNTAIEFKVSKQRCKALGLPQNELEQITEHVKFKYA